MVGHWLLVIMDRTKIIHEFFQNIGIMRRFFAHAPQAPTGMPTHAQVWVMMLLAHAKAMSVQDLALQLTISSSAVTQLVGGLEKSGLVTRNISEENRRKIVVTMTEKGKKVLSQSKKQRFDVFQKLFDVLTNEELLTLKRIQEKVIAHVGAYGKGS